MQRAGSRVLAGALTELCRSVESSATDGTLLAAFVERHDPASFAELVRRHGPMVLGVCLRVLRHRQDAEDAFQATFLVLATKSATVSPPDLVGNWLYGVALQTAVRARAVNMKRRTKEAQVTCLPEAASVPEAGWDDVVVVLDEELGRLPDHYRAVLVLSDVEGRSRKDVAAHLKCPEGSVASRLSRARAMLARRLSRRGVTLPAGAIALLVGQNATFAAVPAALLHATVAAAGVVAAGTALASGVSPAVSVLTSGVLKAMFITKLKPVALAVLMLAFIGSGGAFMSAGAQRSPAGEVKAADANRPPVPATPNQHGDVKGILGTWVVTEIRQADRESTEEERAVLRRGWYTMTFTAERIAVNVERSESGKERRMTYRMDPTKSPKQIDMTPQADSDVSKSSLAIYALDGDTLTICQPNEGKDRPTRMSADGKPGSGHVLFSLRREKPAMEPDAFDARKLVGAWNGIKYVGVQITPWRIEFLKDGKYLHEGKPHETVKTYSLKKDQLTFHGEKGAGKTVTVTMLTDDALIYDDGGKSYEFKRVPPFDAKKLVGGWTWTKVEGMAQPPDGRLEFLADGGLRQSFRRDGQAYSVEGTYALKEDQLWLKTVQGERTKDAKIVTITKLTETKMIFTDNGKSIELTKEKAEDNKALAGRWILTEERTAEPQEKGWLDQIGNGSISCLFDDGKFVMELHGKPLSPWDQFRLDTEKSPKEFHSLARDGVTVQSRRIYELKGDELRLFGWAPREGKMPIAPKTFDPKDYPDEKWGLLIFKRVAPKGK